MYFPKWHLLALVWLNVLIFSETQLYNEGRKTEPRGEGNGNRETEIIGNIDR